jgi:predicted transcriptional regulator
MVRKYSHHGQVRAAMPQKQQPLHNLSRRERQILDIIYRRGRASAAEVSMELPDAPGYSSVRTLLAILERKGHISHTEENGRYVYEPTRNHQDVGQAALKGALQNFYAGSVEKAVAALLDVADTRLSPEEIKRLTRLIKQAKREGR